MNRWLRIAGVGVAGVVGVPLVGALGLFVATMGDHAVLATVTDDLSLPALDVHGLRLHAEAKGPVGAPVVVVLHGGPGDDYRALLPLEPLADEYRLVFYDQRGAGLSERVTAEDLSVDAYVTELDGIIDEFADGPVHLLGHSWGAMLATAYIGRHPERVTSAILVEPGFLTREASGVFMAEVGTPKLSVSLVSHGVWTLFESLHVSGPDADARGDFFMLRFVMGAPADGHPMAGYFCERDPARGVLPHWRFGSAASAAVQSYLADDGTVDIDLTSGVDAFDGPVMIVAGTCNTVIGPEHQARYHLPLFKNGRLEAIEDAGHTLIGERPDVVLPLFRAFLDEASEPTR